jgi:hypothetical protein
MTDAVRPRILSMGMAQAAIYDTKFMEAMPEFRTLLPKVQMIRQQLLQKAGCSGCRRRRIANNLFSDFLHVTMSLQAEGQKRLRDYFGGQPLQLTRQNPATKRYETITI